MYTELGVIESSSQLSLNPAFFGGAELTGFDLALADLEDAGLFFGMHMDKPAQDQTGEPS